MSRAFPDEASRDELVALQRRIAEEAVFEGNVETKTVAGVDQAFKKDDTVSAVVVVRDGETVETATAVRETRMPYIPGLLAFREGEAVVASLRALDEKPDAVLVDGSGRIHPRQAGLATHIGVVLNLPTVGIAKSLLCGKACEPFERLEEGESVPIAADDQVEVPDGTKIGYAYQSKQYSEDATTTVNPLYVSPGHLVSTESAVDIVAESCDSHKLPEPIRRADALADERKEAL